MSVAITYSNLEQLGWSPVVGPSVNPVPPIGWVRNKLPGAMQFYIVGPAYAGALFKCPCPLPPLPERGTLQLDYDLMPDDSVNTYAQALEVDIMLSGPDGRVYNLSQQWNRAEGGNEQIVNAAYKWADVGFNPGVIAPNAWTHFQLNYAFDTVKGASSVTGMSIGGVVPFAVTAAMENIPAQALGWSPNLAVVQVQGDLNAAGGAFSWKMANMNLAVNW